MNEYDTYVLSLFRANSVAWNPHKMMMACLQCCAFMVRDKTVRGFNVHMVSWYISQPLIDSSRLRLLDTKGVSEQLLCTVLRDSCLLVVSVVSGAL